MQTLTRVPDAACSKPQCGLQHLARGQAVKRFLHFLLSLKNLCQGRCTAFCRYGCGYVGTVGSFTWSWMILLIWEEKNVFFLLQIVVPVQERGLLGKCYEVHRAFREPEPCLGIGECSSKRGKDLEGPSLPKFHIEGILFWFMKGLWIQICEPLI